jgi:hypothetical protein
VRLLHVGRRPAKAHGSWAEQAADWADVMGFDRPPITPAGCGWH